MVDILIGSIVFSIGFYAGAFWKTTVFENMDFQIFRWHNSSLGYRKVAPNTTLRRGEKLLMAVSLDTSDFPDEGIEYERASFM